MVWAVFILVFSINSLETWEFLETNQLAVVESWDIVRTGQVDKVREKFPDSPEMTCDHLYMTKKVPFTAIILYRTSGRLLCMGSIVDTRHILSAKRCYEKTDITDVLVLVGYYKAYWGKNSQVLRVEKIIRHDYAIALLRLEDKIKYTDYVKATRLPTAYSKLEKDIKKIWSPPYKVVGFFVDRFDVPGEYIDKDKVYNVKEDTLVEFDKCKTNYSKLVLEDSKLFCTYGNATYCWGGWGGPVLKWMSNSYFLQVGVVIADNCTSDKTSPFLVARTDVFADWIRGNTWHGQQPT